jgi:hypothetical protein
MTGHPRLRARSAALALSGWLLAACSSVDQSPTSPLLAPDGAGLGHPTLEAAAPALDNVSSTTPTWSTDLRGARTGGYAARRRPIEIVTDTASIQEALPAVLRGNAVLLQRWHFSGYLVSMA